MNQREMCLESFTSETFGVLVSGLTNEGYVIDGREIQGIPFSSTQIEHMDQEIFDELCEQFELNPAIKVETAGYLFCSQGAFYILYDTSVHDYQSAQKVLAQYIGTLPEY